MIRKTSKGFQVKSEKGKNLSKGNLTKAQAEKRLAQVEYFKHVGSRSTGMGPNLNKHKHW